MEYRFELALCSALESTDRVVARQLGAAVAAPGSRVVDVCLLEPGPGFDERAAIASDTIPPAAVEAPVGPGTAVPVRDAFETDPGRAAGIVDAAVEAGYLERERRDGVDCVRATARYPDDWVGSLTAVENKPDLGRPGDLEAQLRFDVALGLFDEVVLATASYVTRAHLNRIPDPVGVWRFDPETDEREVVREATPLAPTDPGVEIRDERGLRTDVALVDAAAKARKRRRIAERAYGKGWRPAPPACARAAVTADGRPRCEHFDRVVHPGGECGEGCPAFEADEGPDADLESLRDARSAWVADPDGGGPRRQTGLGRFGE
ncbi:DUF5787 family protein [Haloparvum sedimenti]|uniref:DUF5787 family protein n=1 Tax=Haloparvum sedimenti TaxID=1678448 RepID=UPI00071E7256|nr:DUF5787 family protein [Haloparvum sedimenti]